MIVLKVSLSVQCLVKFSGYSHVSLQFMIKYYTKNTNHYMLEKRFFFRGGGVTTYTLQDVIRRWTVIHILGNEYPKTLTETGSKYM